MGWTSSPPGESVLSGLWGKAPTGSPAVAVGTGRVSCQDDGGRDSDAGSGRVDARRAAAGPRLRRSVPRHGTRHVSPFQQQEVLTPKCHRAPEASLPPHGVRGKCLQTSQCSVRDGKRGLARLCPSASGGFPNALARGRVVVDSEAFQTCSLCQKTRAGEGGRIRWASAAMPVPLGTPGHHRPVWSRGCPLHHPRPCPHRC